MTTKDVVQREIAARLAKLIYDELNYAGPDDLCDHLATALISKLGISQHIITCADGTPLTRWVTIWKHAHD